MTPPSKINHDLTASVGPNSTATVESNEPDTRGWP
jgi:hypothetical protein